MVIHDRLKLNPLGDHYSLSSRITTNKNRTTISHRQRFTSVPIPSRFNKLHADHGTTQPKYGMRRPAPESVERERKIKPFDKKPITFMLHATYNDQVYNILEQGIKPGKSSTPQCGIHVHLASIDDLILDGEPSKAALTHVRDALLILGFLKNSHQGIKLTEERAALSEDTIGPQNIIAVYDSEGQEMQTNFWIMKKNLDKEDMEQYVTKIQEFAQDFFKHVSANKSNKDQSQKTHPQRPRKDDIPLTGAMMMN